MRTLLTSLSEDSDLHLCFFVASGDFSELRRDLGAHFLQFVEDEVFQVYVPTCPVFYSILMFIARIRYMVNLHTLTEIRHLPEPVPSGARTQKRPQLNSYTDFTAVLPISRHSRPHDNNNNKLEALWKTIPPLRRNLS